MKFINIKQRLGRLFRQSPSGLQEFGRDRALQILGLSKQDLVTLRRIKNSSVKEFAYTTLRLTKKDIEEWRHWKQLSRGAKIKELIGNYPGSYSEFMSLTYVHYLEKKKHLRTAATYWKYLDETEHIKTLKEITDRLVDVDKKFRIKSYMEITLHCFFALYTLLNGTKKRSKQLQNGK